MNLTEMIALVRIDLNDQDSQNYRWTDAELTRHIDRAVRELSEQLPRPARATLSTTADAREVDISGLDERIIIQAVEYPLGNYPPAYQRFSLWGDTLTILSGAEPDGADCAVYYGTLHTLDETASTLPARCEDLVATGASAYAAIERAASTINQVNLGGTQTPSEFRRWGSERLALFQERLKKLSWRHKVRSQQLFKTDSDEAAEG